MRGKVLAGYIAVVGLLGLLPLLYSLRALGGELPTGLLVLIILVVVAEVFRLNLPQQSQISVSLVFVMAALALYGLPAAVLVAFIGSLSACLYPVVASLHKSLFNVGSSVLATAAAALVYLSVQGPFTGSMHGSEFSWLGLAAIMIAGGLHYVLQTWLVSGAISLSEGMPFLTVWRQNFDSLSLNYLLLAPIGLALALAYQHLHLFGLISFAGPLVMARFSFALYLEKTAEVRERNEELQSYAEALRTTNESLDFKVQELGALHDVASAVGTSLDLEQTFSLIMELSSKLMRFEVGFLLVTGDSPGFRVQTHYGLKPHELELRALNSYLRQAEETCRPIVVTADDEETTELLTKLFRRWGVDAEAMLLIPVVADGSSLGVIGLACQRPSQEEIQVMSIFAMQAAIAISNARRFHVSQHLAITDGLTGLYNHRYFQERLKQEFFRAQREGSELSLFLLDLDFFKQVNDSFGHQFGDEVLTEMGAVVKESLRLGDDLFRIGGEEFAVLLPRTDAAEARQVAERCRTAVDRHFADFRGRLNELTVSVGLAGYPVDASSKQDLLSYADDALYQAKALGRNRCVRYVSEQTAKALKRGVIDGVDTQAPASLLHSYKDTLHVLAAMIDAKDNYTRGHSERVAEYSQSVLGELELSSEEQETIRMAAMLHDLGKVGISDAILSKPGSLSSHEYEIVKRHPRIGADVLSRVAAFKGLVPIILHHQERWDGKGYPAGLKGEEIPLGARVVAVIDAFEAMVSDRPYRAALGIDEALEELQTHAGSQFDPQIVELFTAVVGSTDGRADKARPPARRPLTAIS